MQLEERIHHFKLIAEQSLFDSLSNKDWALKARDLLDEYFGEFKIDPLTFLEDNLHRDLEMQATFPSLGFSHHPMTLLATKKFNLDLYFWLPGDTLPHDHGFHGAFMPLYGDYLQTHYEFKAKMDLGQGVIEGELIEGKEELMPLHRAYPIFHAPEFIHSVRHDSFCVTLVLRSKNGGEVISDYYPNLRISNDFEETQKAFESWQRLNLIAHLDNQRVESIFKAETKATLLRWKHLDASQSFLKKKLALFLETDRVSTPNTSSST